MSIPFPYPPDMTGIIGFIQYCNVLVSGFMGVGILIIVGFVAFFSTKHYTFDRAFGFSAFLTMIIAILLRFLEMINDAILFLVIVIFISSVILLMKERNVENYGV